MILYTGNVVDKDGQASWYLTDTYTAKGSTYLTTPVATGSITGHNPETIPQRDEDYEFFDMEILEGYTYACGYIGGDSYGGNVIKLLNCRAHYTFNGSGDFSESVIPNATTTIFLENVQADFSTNIPIFDGENSANAYLNAQTDYERSLILQNALNYEGEIPEINEYFYYTRARQYTVDQYGNVTENTAQGEVYRGFRIKTSDTASVYKIDGITEGSLRMGINIHGTPEVTYYSTDGDTWTMGTLPYNWTYRPREDETGTFWASVGDPLTNMYIFKNKEDSDKYNEGEEDGRKASNYNEINSGDFNNPTGDEDEETEFGEVYTRGFFSQQYIMDATALGDLANSLFDTTPSGIWEDIKKGLDMYGDNPIEAVMGLSFWPLSLTSVISGTQSQSYIYFGGYKCDINSGSVNKIIYPNGYKSLGSVTIRRTFNNWRDYAPYTRLYVSLPYVGKYELDLTRYYGKSVEVRYFFDTRSNGCIACLIAGGHLMDYFNGQMGVTMPITLTDFAGYANAQIQTLLGFGGQSVSTGLGSAAKAGELAGAGVGSAALGIAGVGVAGAAIGAKAVYGLSQNNINKFNVTKGSSSSMINEYLPQYVEFTFEIQEDCAPDNYGSQYGYPSMKSGSIGSFQGFLKCQSVKLDCGVATENEKNQIKTLLMNGIYI